jgi:hypothetical protein
MTDMPLLLSFLLLLLYWPAHSICMCTLGTCSNSPQGYQYLLCLLPSSHLCLCWCQAPVVAA